MHYYRHHIGDLIRDTAGLSDSQCMAYLRLLWRYYDTEQPLPNDPELLAFQIGSDAATVGLILRSYFDADGDVWRQRRCDEEIAEFHQFCERQREKGAKGGRPKKGEEKPAGFPVGSQGVAPGSPPESQEKNPNHYPLLSKPSGLDNLGATPAKPEPPPPASPSFIDLPLNTGAEFPISEAAVAEYRKLYPSADVEQELRKMKGWLIANPTKRKTKAGIGRFVNAWLSKAHDEAAASRPGSRPSAGGFKTALERSQEANRAVLFGAPRSARSGPENAVTIEDGAIVEPGFALIHHQEG